MINFMQVGPNLQGNPVWTSPTTLTAICCIFLAIFIWLYTRRYTFILVEKCSSRPKLAVVGKMYGTELKVGPGERTPGKIRSRDTFDPIKASVDPLT